MATKAKKPTATKTSSEVVVKKDYALATADINIEGDSGAGFENTDKDTFAIPFVRILQSGSPQCKKSTPDYIKGAEEGDFFNTVTKEVIKGEIGFTFIPAHYDRKFVEWKPNRGGFAGEHLPSDPILQRAVKKVNDENKEQLVLPNGNSISDTRYHFGLHVKEDGTFTPILVCMSSSGLKVSRRMMTELNGVKIKNAEGRQFTPPMFLNRIQMTSIAESNDQGDWCNYNPTLDGLLNIADPDDAELYLAAKAFRDSIYSGKATVVHDEGEGTGEAEGKF